eukprot:8441837-Heterocapsa_arctica.AAC.1
MPPASSRNSSRDLNILNAEQPAAVEAQHYTGPPEWKHGGLDALHLYLIRFGTGRKRCIHRRDLYACVTKFAEKERMVLWPTHPGQGTPRNASSKSNWINDYWPRALQRDEFGEEC